MMTITSFLKQIAKGAAVQLGVQAIVDTIGPRFKKGMNKLLDKVAEHKTRQELGKIVNDTEEGGTKPSSPKT